MSEKFSQRHSKNVKNKSLASKYSELFPTFSACHYLPRLHLFYSTKDAVSGEHRKKWQVRNLPKLA